MVGESELMLDWVVHLCKHGKVKGNIILFILY
jgi:hypothetical protein